MIKPIDAVELAQQLEINNCMSMHHNFLAKFQEDASDKGIKFISELLYAFMHQLVAPFDKTYIVHRELRASKEYFFNKELPEWCARIEGMSVTTATNNYLWLHQVREGAFEQYLVGYSIKMSKLLKNHRQDNTYLEQVTKTFCEVLMTTVYTTLEKQALGVEPMNVEAMLAVN